MTEEQTRLLQSWNSSLLQIYNQHYSYAIRLNRLNYWFSFPIIIISAVIGTSLFATISQQQILFIRVLVAASSLTVAVVSALQVFMKFPERAEKHHEAGAKFAALHKELSQIIAFPPNDESNLYEWISIFRKAWDDVRIKANSEKL